MADLTYGGTDIRNRSSIFLDLTSGFDGPAEVRGTDTVVPGRAGRIARSRIRDRRIIALEGYVTGADATTWRTNMDSLNTLFDPAVTRTLVVTAPYLGLASGSRSINARTTSVVIGGIVASRFCRVSIELEAIDPPDWS